MQKVKTTTLTQRECEVMNYVKEALSNKQISEILFITPSTVKAHVSSVIRKLNAKNRLDAAMIMFGNKKS